MAQLFNPAIHSKFLIFHQHRGLAQVTCFVFINIVASSKMSLRLFLCFLQYCGFDCPFFYFPFFRATGEQ